MESSLRSGNFPTLSAFAKQATASNNSNNNNKNSSNSGNSGNNDADVSYYKELAVAYIDLPAEPTLAVS